jgi:hypothetical protein
MKCGKCDGEGIIQGFSHVRGGICFQCNGTGVVPDPKKGTVSHSKMFVNQFLNNTFFPEDQTGMEIVKRLKYPGETAEKDVLKDDTFFYVGQPVCRSSTWWKIPHSQFTEFAEHYMKSYKENIL